MTTTSEGETGKVTKSDSNLFFVTNYGAEICFVLSSIADCISLISVQNFYVERICRVEKNFSVEECRHLTEDLYVDDERRVELSASKYTIYQSLIESGPPILISFFLGPWIDKNGSKLVLVLCLLGFFLSSFMYMINSFLPNLPPGYILTCSVPVAMFGGWTALFIAGMSLVARETSIKERSFRMTTLGVCMDAGSAIGYLIGKKIFYLWGFEGVFMISNVLYGLSVTLALLLIHEKTPKTSLSSDYATNSSKWSEFLDLESVKETLVTCFKKREHRRRGYLS